VTTQNERSLFEKIVSIIGADKDVQAKDTESYYGVLYQGKQTDGSRATMIKRVARPYKYLFN
jgi:hypothetical protein